MKKKLVLFAAVYCFVVTTNAQEVFTKYPRWYQTGSLGNFTKSGTFDINTPDNAALWSDYPSYIGYATLNVFGGDKMFTQLLSNSDNSRFWIRTSNYTDGIQSANGLNWNQIWHSGNLNKYDVDFAAQNIIANGKIRANFQEFNDGGYDGAKIESFRSPEQNNLFGLNFYTSVGYTQSGNAYQLAMSVRRYWGGSGYISQLEVPGTIHAKEVKVDLTGWSDFVFHPAYKLKPLTEVEHYIQTNGHLENIPSAEQVEKNGVSIGEMQAKLLEKVEELTLYVIEQNKKAVIQNAKIEALEEKIKKLESSSNPY